MKYLIFSIFVLGLCGWGFDAGWDTNNPFQKNGSWIFASIPTVTQNVGINSTAPGQALDVKGGIRSSFTSGPTVAAYSIVCIRPDGALGICQTGVSANKCTTCQ